MQKTQKTVIIVAGGIGKRFGGAKPKQFVLLGDKPMIVWSIEAFYTAIPDIEIMVAIPQGYGYQMEEIIAQFLRKIPLQIVEGGEERFHTVSNSLKKIQNISGLVAVHDAARPLASVEFIKRTFMHCFQFGSAVPALPLADSLRQLIKEEWVSVNRNNFRRIQTPQIFHSSELIQAYDQPYNSEFTDDASVMEASGLYVNLCEGDERAFKITSPLDFEYANYLVSSSKYC